MSRLRILVEVDGETIVDRDEEVSEWGLDTKNGVADTGRGRYRTSTAPTGFETVGDSEYPHLRLACDLCGYTFNMKTRDAK